MTKKAKADLMKKIHGGQICQIISTAVRIGLPLALNRVAKNLDQLTEELKVDREALGRLIGTLMTMKIVEFADEEKVLVRLTIEGEYLVPGIEGSLGAIAAYKGSPLVWRALGRLEEGIRSGESPFLLEFGKPLFEHLKEVEEDREVYDRAMACYEENSSKVLFDEYSMEGVRRIIDIGGGLGGFIREVRKRYPGLECAMMDLPEVVSRARKIEENRGIELIEGDFFEEVPSGYDCYLMRNILHDWGDKQVKEILGKIVGAMDENGRLLVFETVVEPIGEGGLGKFADLMMFTQTPGGRERSEGEYRELFIEVGLELVRVLRSSRSKAMLECKKI